MGIHVPYLFISGEKFSAVTVNSKAIVAKIPFFKKKKSLFAVESGVSASAIFISFILFIFRVHVFKMLETKIVI